MGRLVAGDLVKGDFPFSEPQTKEGTQESVTFKPRPCIVLAAWKSGNTTDVLVCMVTSRKKRDPHAVPFDENDLVWGNLPEPGLARPMYLFAGKEDRFEKKGQLKSSAFASVCGKIRELLNGETA